MFPMTPPFALLAALALGAAMQSAPARAQHDHATHAHVTPAVPPRAQRWDTDAALRDGMDRIHTALEELRHYEMGHMDLTMALDRVGLIEQAAADIFARCKLPPQRDAVLHGMLVSLLGAAREFRADPQDMAQVEAMRTAVADYPRYFDAPRWHTPTSGAR
ncbi:DnrO protein [Frateuria sp. STR12]|uniref:DnrO protein n=1 Tax=Frateuria hangzhouensis TaxID=2995589 RepID=UPI002260CFC9|nr:DnrO protein [Frateuria sp. STR12]MCX7515038.1 DnrO protein [Frateuria sp. STR12]